MVIYGEGKERSALEKLVRSLGLIGRVRLPGHVADLAPCLPQADLFVLSSDYEGAPAVLVEALAAGVPIVSTASSDAIKDLLLEGKLGHIVPVGNESALAGAIARPKKIDRQAAQQHALLFSLEEGAAAYLRLFQNLIVSAEQAGSKSREPELVNA